MSVGTWEPAGAPPTIDAAKLDELLAVASGDLDALATTLPPAFVNENKKLMQLEAAAWTAAEALEDSALEALVRFFTLVEMQVPGWEGGKRNPVIYLVRILKARGTFTPELRKWVKANTDNRYLPNGAAL